MTLLAGFVLNEPNNLKGRLIQDGEHDFTFASMRAHNLRQNLQESLSGQHKVMGNVTP